MEIAKERMRICEGGTREKRKSGSVTAMGLMLMQPLNPFVKMKWKVQYAPPLVSYPPEPEVESKA